MVDDCLGVLALVRAAWLKRIRARIVLEVRARLECGWINSSAAGLAGKSGVNDAQNLQRPMHKRGEGGKPGGALALTYWYGNSQFQAREHTIPLFSLCF